MYNLNGELVGPRNRDGPTTSGAHFSNTDAEGNWIVKGVPKRADWHMQSLCAAHLEQKYNWGDGIGFEDDIFLTVSLFPCNILPAYLYGHHPTI